MEKQSKFRVALLDSDFILYSATYNKEGEEVKSFEKVIQDADNTILNLFNMTEATHYIGAFTIGRGFRYNIYPEYKANRKDKVKPLYFKALREYLIEKWKFISHPDLESDDIVNICHKNMNVIDNELFMISPDKDVLNLEGKHFDAKNLKWREVISDEADEYFWKSMITGDATDAIKGVPKKGIKYAENLIEEDDFGTPFGALILNEYIKTFGEQQGIEEFYKNYKCLKILDKYEGFVIPEPIKIDYVLET